ncbi:MULTISPECIES: NAD-dependent epimerase/dehydratase family protein [unclassified Tenacibaculum]|uniref:NAD-dependent epimerase/dehydratase family protein n=1 Tax=unclassified Tenacibaculum TaxID=2635139 RepID=UPI001F3F2F75|nr:MULTISPECIES: NAD-dependent epimerase/dehydratase family protein [unclassified Tenacibaculum]MCF2873719.1 NAD-dependent epimerase/dehydratase family protein [Tenacibaculum sp. Cn5-1]MCF2933875.1 NAD-dependent epimerase/dehydratase family protein [Tenacibaculum sp. Cn5-34]MCG7509543.1 NAD-dependent epimerase/dehydratase family protein [Tenacibaculum sp. Cn5-46]
MKRVIITGSTGMVGKGVLLECLDNVNIEKVLVINRSTLNIQHSKLEEVLLKDFSQLTSIKDKLIGYDACFFCMGISSVGMNEEKYTQITFNIVKVFADVLHKINSNMVFNYVSGTGTDSSENGSSMWARVKGKTENYIFNKGFKDAYAFRPGAIIPEKGIKSRTNWYSIIYILLTPFFGLMKKSKNITTTTKIGLAMINSLHHTQTLKHLENKDINVLAEKLS